MKNNNNEIVKNLSLKYMASNKEKFVVIMISIILTSVLFTTVLTLASGMKESFELQTMRQVGTTAHGSVKYLTTEEAKKLYNNKNVNEYGASVIIGECINDKLSKRRTEIRYADENYSKWSFSEPFMGKLPTSINEIAIDTIVLEKLGIPVEIGSKVIISYMLNGERVDEEFMLSGIFEGDIFSSASKILVSKNYMEKVLNTLDQNYNKSHNQYQGLYNVDMKFFDSSDIEHKMLQLLSDSGFDPKKMSIGVNWGYLSTGFDDVLSYFIPIVIALALISFTGYMIINNIFSIFIAKDIKSYSLLKTIGASNRQIKHMIIMQIVIVSIISIPIGVIIGYLIGNRFMPYFLTNFNINYMKITFNPMIYISASVVSAATVIISSLKPARRAGSITPIEGMKYEDDVILSGKAITFDGKLYRMSLLNLLRNKKKIISVVISIALSLALLCDLGMIVNGFDKDKFLSEMVISDFQFAKNEYYSFGTEDKSLDIPRDYIEMIESLDGFENGGGVYYKASYHNLEPDKVNVFRELELSSDLYHNDSDHKNIVDYYIKNNKIPTQLYGIDAYGYDKLQIDKGEFDKEKFKTGKYVVLFPYDDEIAEGIYKVGEKVDIELSDGTTKEYEIMAIGSIKYNMSIRYYIGSSIAVILPATEVNNMQGFELYSYIFDAKDEAEKGVVSYLDKFTTSVDDGFNYKSKFDYDKDFENSSRSYWIIGGALIAITTVIGLLNFINITYTSIESRRYEFAVMRSIGMTGGQLQNILIFEGLIVIILSLLVGTAISLLTAYGLIRSVVSNIWFYTFRLDLSPIVYIIAPLMLIAIAIPIFAYRSTYSKSATESIREATI